MPMALNTMTTIYECPPDIPFCLNRRIYLLGFLPQVTFLPKRGEQEQQIVRTYCAIGI